ncbi:hypothetical protein HMI55_005281 [Coelomomyces lativittatus]|nr:hypothetical protein HMI55_005281 [Coelomomyces lativittatus]
MEANTVQLDKTVCSSPYPCSHSIRQSVEGSSTHYQGPTSTTTIAVDATPNQIAIQTSPSTFKIYKSQGSIFFNETKAIFLSLFLQPTKCILSDNQAAIASFKRGFSTNVVQSP